MKRSLLFALAFFFLGTSINAQVCERDSNLLNFPETTLLSPAPYTPDSPAYNLKLACIDEQYEQSITVKVPPTFLVFTIDSIVLDRMNGINNLPSGLSYTCDPPNCNYLPNTLGCLQLSGVPDMSINAPDTFDMTINVTIYTNVLDQAVELPVDLAPEDHFYLIVNPPGGCAVGVDDAEVANGPLELFPNPTSGDVNLRADMKIGGDYQLQVFDVLGRQQFAQTVNMLAGNNTVPLNIYGLEAGIYQVVLSNTTGRSTARLVITR